MKPKTKTILFILLSFFLGILVGWYAEDHYLIKSIRAPKNFQQTLTEKLRLNEQQIVRVDSILESHKQQMDFYRKSILAVRDTIRTEIRHSISAEQNKLFDEMIREMENRDMQKHPRAK